MKNRTQLAAEMLARLRAAEEAMATANGELEAAQTELDGLRESLQQTRNSAPATDAEAGALAGEISAMTARAEVLEFKLRGLKKGVMVASDGLDAAIEFELPALEELIAEREAELRMAAAEALGRFCSVESNLDFVISSCGRIQHLNGLFYQIKARFYMAHDVPDVLNLVSEFLEPLAGAAVQDVAATTTAEAAKV